MIFIDASALVAILVEETDWRALERRLEAAPARLTSAVAVFEASLAIARILEIEPPTAMVELTAYLAVQRIDLVDIGPGEAQAAIAAHARFGKGRHPARLNLGDCFAYACARTHGARLLFKGDDFALTDIEPA